MLPPVFFSKAVADVDFAAVFYKALQHVSINFLSNAHRKLVLFLTCCLVINLFL
jgi:hypothetical protein